MRRARRGDGECARPENSAARRRTEEADWGSALEQARRDIERDANKDTAVFLLSFFVLNIALVAILTVNYSQGLSLAIAYYFMPLCIILLICCCVAFCFRFDRPWIRYLLLIGAEFFCASAYFVFSNPVSCYFILPVIISTRYLDRKLVHRVAVVTALLFVVIIVANLYLQNASEMFQTIHDENAYNPWVYAIDVVVYVVTPLVFALVYVVYYSLSVTKAGSRLISLQAEESGRIAAVETELGMAADIQRTTLPDESFETANGNFVLSAREIPAREVGGDFYDYYLADENTLCVLVADVSDKGVPAALFMMSAKKALESAVECCHSLEEAVTLATRLICRDNERDMFLTLWIGMVDIRTGKGKYANAGHLPPILRHASGDAEWLVCEPDLFIGNFPDMPPTVHCFSLAPGDTLVLYTDGVTDAQDGDGGVYGAENLLRTVCESAGHAEELCEAIVGRARRYSAPSAQFDDITVLALECVRVEDTRTLNLCVCADGAGTDALAIAVNGLLVDLGCPDDARRKVAVIVDELASNIVENAYPDGEAGTMRLRAQAGGNFIEVQLEDAGIAFDPLAHAVPARGDELKIGGFGIYFVRELADEVRYERTDGRNVISFCVLWNL